MSKEKSEPSLSEQLQALFNERFGDDWRRDLTTTLRADHLYWFFALIERGIQGRLDDWRQERGSLGASEAASAASWEIDLQQWFDKIKDAVSQPQKKTKGKGKK